MQSYNGFRFLLLVALLLSACEHNVFGPDCSPASRCLPTDYRSELGIKARVVTWEYDANGRLTFKFFSPISSLLSAGSYYTYDTSGRLLSLRRENHMVARKRVWDYGYEYDGQDVLIRRNHYTLIEDRSSSPATLIRQSNVPYEYDVYGYNAQGQRISMQTFKQDGTPVYPEEEYEYDGRNNVTKVYLKWPHTSFLAASYSYDKKNSIHLWEPDTGDSPVNAPRIWSNTTSFLTREEFPISRNNVTQEVRYDSTGAITSNIEYKYKYNKHCFPKEKDSYTIKYNCP